ncbi:MAG TPA: hypothetical protein VN611_14540 [Patescibacteria group bacterium]|nr:hypothetical protein [Patescibacteria group bacterium]
MRNKVVQCLALSLIAFGVLLGGCGGDKKEAASPAPAAAPAKEESLANLLDKGKNAPGMTYDYVMTGKDMQMNGKMWIAGKKIRNEVTVQNMKMVSIIDGEAKVAYNYNADQKMAMKVSLDKAKVADGPDHFTRDADLTRFKVLESTVYEGVKCKVVTRDDPENKIKAKMWIREDYGLPMRVENEVNDEKMVIEYKNLQVGPLPPETFTLPADVKVTDLGQMMQQIPKQP